MHHFVTILYNITSGNNQPFGYGNHINFIFGLKPCFEMSVGNDSCS